jgi:division protein 1
VDGEDEGELVNLGHVAEEEDGEGEELIERADGKGKAGEVDSACVRVLEGHSKAVTALYFEDECLVTGASDKTLRQWDLTTGQCVMTMDILWAISHPPTAQPGTGMPHGLFPGAAAAAGTFAVPTPPNADGSWDMYQDFVGGVQFWGYALVSGSGDGAVRMWDSECHPFSRAEPRIDCFVSSSADGTGASYTFWSHWACNMPSV